MKSTLGKAAAAGDDEQAHHDAEEAAEQMATNPKTRRIDPTIISALEDHLAETGMPQAKLAPKIGSSTTYLSKALNGTFNGNVAEFEKGVLDYFEALTKRRVDNTDVCETGFLVEAMRDFLDTVKLTGDIGVGYNPAGKGKTKGIEVYLRKNALAVMVTVTKSFCGWRSVRDAVLAQVANKRRAGGESWDQFMLRTFRGSGRLLILDNAHLLTNSARTWIAYDWHESTGCPVALIGNPQIVQQWKGDDQQFSRVGLAREIKPMDKETATATARKMIELHVPDVEVDGKLLKYAVDVLKGKGACRALRKHLLLMQALLKGNPNYLPSAAFYAAHSQLLSDVKFTEMPASEQRRAA